MENLCKHIGKYDNYSNMKSYLFFLVLLLSLSCVSAVKWTGTTSTYNFTIDNAAAMGDNTGTSSTQDITGLTNWVTNASGCIDGACANVVLGSGDLTPPSATYYSFCQWVKRTGTPPYAYIFDLRTAHAGGLRLDFRSDNTIAYQFAYEVHDDSGDHYTYSSGPAPLNIWVFVCAITNSTHATLFINGKQNSTIAIGTNSALAATTGEYGGVSGYELTAKLDEMRIYNVALTNAQIWEYYQTEAGLLPSDTCTPPAINNNWNVLFSDNCTLSTNTNLGTGILNAYGSAGTLFLKANLTANGSKLSCTGTNCRLVGLPFYT